MPQNESAPSPNGAPQPGTENRSNHQKEYSTNLDLALILAGRGWFVFPCNPGPDPARVKKPYTKHGKDDATIDQAQIIAWWKRWPEALIGIYCEKSGIFAVDVDSKNGTDGYASWYQLAAKYGEKPEVPCGPSQRTPNNGQHLIFRLPDNIVIPNNASKLAPGIDLRSNGYICTGGQYIWLDGHEPTTELSNAPAWLLDEIHKLFNKPNQTSLNGSRQQLAASNKIEWAAELLTKLSPSRCDDYDSWIKVGMALSELGEPGFQLWDAWSQKSPKYKPGECASKWKSFKPGGGITLGTLYQWSEENVPIQRATSSHADFGGAGSTIDPADDEPREFDTDDNMPIDAFTPPLPDTAKLSDALMKQAEKSGKWLSDYVTFGRKAAPMAPEIFHEFLGLSLLSTVIARRIYTRQSNKNIFTNLYTLIVANSTLFTKSTAFDIALEALEKAGLSFFTLPRSITPQALVSEMTNRTPDNLSSWDKEDQENWREERKFSAQRAWWMDEVSGLFAMFEQKTTEDLENFVLQLYNCTERLQASQTIGRGRQTLRNTYLTICGPTTPAALRPYFQKLANWGNGMNSRFLYITPNVPPEIRFFPDPLEMPETIFAPLKTLAIQCLPVPKEVDGHFSVDAIKVELGTGVREAWEKYYTAIYSLMRTQKVPEKLYPNYGRLTETAMKIAMQLAAIDWAMNKPTVLTLTVTASHWAKAQILTEKSRASLHRLIEDTTRQGADDDTEQKIDILLKSSSKGLTARQIAQKLHKAGRDRLELDSTLALLVKDGVLRKEVAKGKAGPSTELFLLPSKTRSK